MGGAEAIASRYDAIARLYDEWSRSVIEDVVKVFEYEDLREVLLIGHSYGGMVATGVADRIPDRISQVIYLDAFVPRHGESLNDLAVPEDRNQMREAAQKAGDAMRLPPRAMPPAQSRFAVSQPSA